MAHTNTLSSGKTILIGITHGSLLLIYPLSAPLSKILMKNFRRENESSNLKSFTHLWHTLIRKLLLDIKWGVIICIKRWVRVSCNRIVTPKFWERIAKTAQKRTALLTALRTATRIKHQDVYLHVRIQINLKIYQIITMRIVLLRTASLKI